MPSDIMDQRNMSSFYSRPSENRFPSERSVGFWKNGSVSDHRGLEAMPFMSGGKIISSQLEKLCQTGGNFVDNLELSHNAFKDQKRNISFEHHFMGTESTANYWKANGQDVASLAKIYGQPALQSAEPDNGALNEGHYENGLFSSSLSDILNKRLRLALKDSFVGQSTDATRSNMVEDESFESLEEMEAQAIGDLLPDDDDLLSGAHDLGYFARTNRTDAEDDLFCSLGGMELESDEFSSKKASDNLTVNGQRGGLDKLPSSELPCGEHPSRTLFVKNIDGIDDMELRVIFEQFGEIQKLFTTCRRRGFIIVSYYDIRAAQNAIRVLQTKSIRHPKLDIHFCVTSDNLSENDINLGALVVTNLDSSISNDDLLHIFSAYGQIKEICGIPNKPHLKVIEFYDVQAAETALLDLNRHGAALNRIKVEPCCPGDASSIRQVGLDLEDKQSNGCRQQNYSQMPSETFVPSGLMTLGTNTTSGLHNGAMLGMHSAFDLPNGSSMKSKFHGISSGSIPQSLSSPARFAMMGSRNVQSGDNELSYSLSQRNLGFQSMQTFPEFHHDGGLISGMPYHSPSTMSAMPMSINSSLTSGVDNRNIHRVGSTTHSSHTFEQNEAAYSVLGNGSGSLNGHEYIWNNSTTAHCLHRPGWQNLPPFMNSSMSPQTTQVHGLTGGPSHIPNTVLNLQQHAGSAPAVDPSLFYGRHTFSGDGGASFHPSSLGTIGYSSCSPVHALELTSHNLYRHAAGNCIDPSIASPHVGIPSPQQRSHMFRGRNSATPMLASHETPNDRTRSRRHDPSVVNQADNRKQYELDVDRIIRGEDSRTTLMVKNIPNKYTSKMLLATIDEQHKGTYDFIYLPIDFKNKCNVGYAFINVTDPQHIIPFYQSFNGKKWEKFNSEKVASLAYARIQGKAALVAHFQNSSLMNEDKRCRPILFHSDGPNAGDQEPFPMGVNIRSRRSRTSTENHQGSPSSSSSEESSNAVGSPSGCPPRILIEHASFSKAI